MPLKVSCTFSGYGDDCIYLAIPWSGEKCSQYKYIILYLLLRGFQDFVQTLVMKSRKAPPSQIIWPARKRREFFNPDTIMTVCD
jgi:hypothetical protein